eukprot:scaffold3736_cov103-Cylindrotheca_fusiformis.AAC.8
MPLDSPPQDAQLVEELDDMAFFSVSKSVGSAMLDRIEQLEEETGASSEMFGESSGNWKMKMFVETTRGPQDYRDATSNFYWFRIVLFALLICSPICRAAYLWWAGGGRIRIRRNENGRFAGFQYTPPISYWFVSNNTPRSAPIVTDKLEEAEVMALPEITYKAPPPDENYAKDESESAQPLEDVSIAIGSGSADPEKEVKNTQQQPLPDEEQTPQSAEETLTTTSTGCSICLDDFEVGERLRLLPRCRHAFHTECILPWLTQRQGCCPLCKSNVLESGEGNTSIDEDSNTLEENANDGSDADEDDPESQRVEDQVDAEIRLSEASETSHNLHDDGARVLEPSTSQEEQLPGNRVDLENASLQNVRKLVCPESLRHGIESRICMETEKSGKNNPSDSITAVEASSSSDGLNSHRNEKENNLTAEDGFEKSTSDDVELLTTARTGAKDVELPSDQGALTPLPQSDSQRDGASLHEATEVDHQNDIQLPDSTRSNVDDDDVAIAVRSQEHDSSNGKVEPDEPATSPSKTLPLDEGSEARGDQTHPSMHGFNVLVDRSTSEGGSCETSPFDETDETDGPPQQEQGDVVTNEASILGEDLSTTVSDEQLELLQTDSEALSALLQSDLANDEVVRDEARTSGDSNNTHPHEGTNSMKDRAEGLSASSPSDILKDKVQSDEANEDSSP